MRLPSRSIALARRLERALARTPLATLPWARGLGDRARSRFERRHPALARPVAEASMNGVRLLAPTAVWRAYLERRFDPLTTARVRALLRPGMVVIDVGAHIGYYTLLAGGRLGRRGRIHAVEPCPENLELLRDNVARFAAAPVEVHALAAGRESGARTLLLSGLGDTSGFYPHPLAATRGVVAVQQRALDELIAPPVHLIKVDVEGAELEVLAGMPRLLAGSPAVTLLLEWNPACLRAAGRDPEELLAWLDERGFRTVALDEEAATVLPLDLLRRRLDAGELPEHWYCNLWSEPGEAPQA